MKTSKSTVTSSTGNLVSMDFSKTITQRAFTSITFLILLCSTSVVSEAEFNHGSYMPRNIDPNISEIFSPEMCYQGSHGIAESCKWPGGVFVYDIDDKIFSSDQLDALYKIHYQISEATGHCITFRRKTDSDTTYILITKSNGCTTPVGRRIGRQVMSLTDECFEENIRAKRITFIHMLSLGLWVEHGREDRDYYVRVFEENVYEGFLPLFRKVNGSTYGTPYDYNSLLHFSEDDYTRNGYRTIFPYALFVDIGHANFLSKLDVTKVRNLYSCS